MARDEVFSEEMDSILMAISDLVEKKESGISFIDKGRMMEMYASNEILQTILRDSKAKIQFLPHNKYASVGVIRILAKKIDIKQTKLLSQALKFASNFEIYPRTDGRFMLALTFYGLTKKV